MEAAIREMNKDMKHHVFILTSWPILCGHQTWDLCDLACLTQQILKYFALVRKMSIIVPESHNFMCFRGFTLGIAPFAKAVGAQL